MLNYMLLIVRVYIDYVILIADSLTLRYRVAHTATDGNTLQCNMQRYVASATQCV